MTEQPGPSGVHGEARGGDAELVEQSGAPSFSSFLFFLEEAQVIFVIFKLYSGFI